MLAIACAAAPSAQAQEARERVVAVLDFVPLAGASNAYAQLCSDTVGLELERLGYVVVAPDKVRSSFKGNALDDAAAIALARRLEADVVVTGFYVIEADQIRIGVRAIDALAEAVAVSVQESGAAGFEVFDTIDGVAARVAQRVRAALQPIQKAEVVIERENVIVETTVVEEVVELGVPVTLTLRSRDEGAQIVAGDQVLGTVTDGVFVLDTKADALLVLTLRSPGFHDRTVKLVVNPEKPERRLPGLVRVAGRELAFATGLDRPFGLDGAVRWHFLDGLLAAQAAAGFHFIPYSYPDFLSFGQDSNLDVPGGAFDLNLGGGGRVYPLAPFAKGLAFQPFLSASLDVDILLMTGDQLGFSLTTRLGLGAGVKQSFRAFDLAASFAVVSPVFLGLGTMPGTGMPTLRLLLEVALPW
ncbi:MAG TPA: hypothetical protein PK625_06095 [Spirochaetales bacterium]|nr:hypothetical protein [Spirochaetales bacterium]